MRFDVQIVKPFVGGRYNMAARSYKEAAETAVQVHYLGEALGFIHEARRHGKVPSFSSNVFYVPEICVCVSRTKTMYFNLRATLKEIS